MGKLLYHENQSTSPGQRGHGRSSVLLAVDGSFHPRRAYYLRRDRIGYIAGPALGNISEEEPPPSALAPSFPRALLQANRSSGGPQRRCRSFLGAGPSQPAAGATQAPLAQPDARGNWRLATRPPG